MLFEDQYFMVKERNDNKDGQRGGLYQALVSLKYALEYIDKPFCKLTLEHKGDVTFDTYQQIEVKHHAPKCSLGDYHVGIVCSIGVCKMISIRNSYYILQHIFQKPYLY